MINNDHRPALRDYLKILERVPETFRRSWDAIAIYDLDGRLVIGNAAARNLVGAESGPTLVGQHFSVHLALDQATTAARAFANVVKSGEVVDAETVFREANGTAIPVRTRLVPARLDGRVVGVIGFARDIRPQRSAESQFMRSEQQFRSLFENHPDALAIHDLQGRFTRINHGEELLSGYAVDELIGQTPAIMAPSGEWDVDRRIRDAIACGEHIQFTHPIRTKSGELREIAGRAIPLTVDGAVRGFCAIVHDVTEERRHARDTSRQAQRIAELYRIAASPSLSADDRVQTALETGTRELGAATGYVGKIVDGAVEVVRTCGRGAPESGTRIPLDDSLVQHALERNDVFVAHSAVIAPLQVDQERFGVVTFGSDGEDLRFAVTDRDYVRALAALLASAVQQSERERRLDTLAFHDALTGLPNRALFQDRLEQTLLVARRHRRSFAAHYIDVDHFKTINDTYGHAAGDGVLVAVAHWLRTILRDSDTIARIGGDEFVVLQPEIDSQRQAEELAGKLVSIRRKRFAVGDEEVQVTISVGCAVFPADAENPVDMLRAADAALYAVKRNGRDGFSVGLVR